MQNILTNLGVTPTNLLSPAQRVFIYFWTAYTARGLWPESWVEKFYSDFAAYGVAASIHTFLQTRKLLHLPFSVQQIFVIWLEQGLNLDVVTSVPSCAEVLQAQCAGRRIVTCFEDKASWSAYVNGERDPLEFLVHDLVHASHFFNGPVVDRDQVDFFSRLQKLWHQEEFQRSMHLDPHFKMDMEYLASDMNSHSAHMQSYFSAKCYEHIKRSGYAGQVWSL